MYQVGTRGKLRVHSLGIDLISLGRRWNKLLASPCFRLFVRDYQAIRPKQAVSLCTIYGFPVSTHFPSSRDRGENYSLTLCSIFELFAYLGMNYVRKHNKTGQK
jgi:hypothetical protein